MPNPASSLLGEPPEEDPRLGPPSAREPVRISVRLSPDALRPDRTVWPVLLQAGAIPLLVAAAAYGLRGDVSGALLRWAAPVMVLLTAAYGTAAVLSGWAHRFPFLNSFEAAFVSGSLTLVPAGTLLVGISGPPTDALALLGTGASLGWLFAMQYFRSRRDARLLVRPGGAADRLLGLPGIAAVEEAGADQQDESRSAALDGIVVDPQVSSRNGREDRMDGRRSELPRSRARRLYQLLTARLPLSAPFTPSVDRRMGQPLQRLKRVLDLLLIVVSLPVTVPLLGVTALAIRLGSRGPILFWQARVGQARETFQMAKFRSMHVGHKGEDDAVFADEDDDRVTPVGRFIRTTRIDELPQIWNVLKGEMSLIGPRPEQVELAENFEEALPRYHARHLVRPGITGWAQVLQGYAADVDETRQKLEHDLYYVKHRSLLLDLLIVYLTCKTLLTGFGAR